MGEAVAVEFDAQATTGAEVGEHRFQIHGGVGLRAIAPDADVGDVGGLLRLTEIGGAGQQRDPAISRDIKALEKAEAERVIAGEPIIALLREKQQI